MISFKKLTDISPEMLADMLGELDGEALEELDMLYGSFSEIAAEVGVAVTASHGCLAVRICDGGEYYFPFPFALTDSASVTDALYDIAEYTRRESIPLHFTDVPRSELGVLTSVFPHVNARAYEDDEDCFAAVVLNELDLVSEPLHAEYREVVLSPLEERDKAAYARLCSNSELNRYWGYDAMQDNPDGDPDRFLAVALSEAADGVAQSLAVRVGTDLVGEAVVYDFDYCGTAEIAVRVLPEWQGRGIGSAALTALIELCSGLGLHTVRARVREENAAGLALISAQMVELSRADGVVSFVLLLDNTL